MGLHDREAAEWERGQQQLNDAWHREIERVQAENRRETERQRAAVRRDGSHARKKDTKSGGGFFRLLILAAIAWFLFTQFQG